MGKKSKKMKADHEEKEKKGRKKSDQRMKTGSAKPQMAANPPPIDPALRYQMIETAAYYIAEKHGFDPQKSIEDWAQAEREIDARLQEQQKK